MTAAAIAVPNTFQFSDAAVFGRVSEKVAAYMAAMPKHPSLVEVAFEKLSASYANYMAARALSRMSDRMLNDMGLVRGDLGQIA